MSMFHFEAIESIDNVLRISERLAKWNNSTAPANNDNSEVKIREELNDELKSVCSALETLLRLQKDVPALMNVAPQVDAFERIELSTCLAKAMELTNHRRGHCELRFDLSGFKKGGRLNSCPRRLTLGLFQLINFFCEISELSENKRIDVQMTSDESQSLLQFQMKGCSFFQIARRESEYQERVLDIISGVDSLLHSIGAICQVSGNGDGIVIGLTLRSNPKNTSTAA